MSLKLLDLFSGIGGFSLAGRWAGFETIQFVEKDTFCQKVLKKNFPDVPIHDDIKTFNFTDSIDLVTGGFPCQPFSVAGKKKGKNDDRYLWPEVFRIIKQCRPNWFIGENVPGIIPMLDTILEDLEKQNYYWRAFIIPASFVRAPHKRERLWIIAHTHSERFNNRSDTWKERYLQNDKEWNFETLQSEWTQFIPQSWATFDSQNWFTNSNGITSEQANKKTITKSNEWNSRMGYPRQDRKISTSPDWQENQPPIPGVDDGLPNGVDRNKSLGNSIVPQVVFPIMKLIYEIETSLKKL